MVGFHQCKVKEKRADAVHDTIKAAVLKNDSCSSNLIIASCYNQKPFYMISHHTTVAWVEYLKQIGAIG